MEFQEQWQELKQVLHAERESYQRLSILLSDEHGALRRFEHLTLPSLAEEKERVLVTLHALGRRRLHLCRVLTHGTGDDDPEKFQKRFSAMDHEDGRAAAGMMDSVLSLARQAATQARQNAGLISRGLSIVQEALRLIHAGGDIPPVYGEGGRCRLPSGPSSLSIQG